jgi:hypothetical protein
VLYSDASIKSTHHMGCGAAPHRRRQVATLRQAQALLESGRATG